MVSRRQAIIRTNAGLVYWGNMVHWASIGILCWNHSLHYQLFYFFGDIWLFVNCYRQTIGVFVIYATVKNLWALVREKNPQWAPISKADIVLKCCMILYQVLLLNIVFYNGNFNVARDIRSHQNVIWSEYCMFYVEKYKNAKCYFNIQFVFST